LIHAGLTQIRKLGSNIFRASTDGGATTFGDKINLSNFDTKGTISTNTTNNTATTTEGQ
jgi:hypothetical protein